MLIDDDVSKKGKKFLFQKLRRELFGTLFLEGFYTNNSKVKNKGVSKKSKLV